MKNKKCVVCSKVKGKRVCQLNNNTLICPRCCAQIRNHDCEGCRYYATHEPNANTNPLKTKSFAMRVNPQVDELVAQALTAINIGNLSTGESIISNLLKQHPDIHTVQCAMGIVCAMKGQYEESIAYFDKAIEIYPDFVEAWFNKATSYQRELEVAGAIKAFQKVVELGNPTADFVHRAKDFITGMANQIYQENGLSLDVYLKCNDMFEDAFATMQNGEYEKALMGFQAVVAINPQNPQSYGNMGICYAQLGQKPEALAAFDKALELDPKYEPAMLNRAIFSSLEEGTELHNPKIKPMDYYKEYPLQNKSLLEPLLERFKD